MSNAYIHPGPDRRPRERCVGYGIPYPDGTLAVPCGYCKAAIGQECDRRRRASAGDDPDAAHCVRIDRARNLFQGKAYRLFCRLENEALARDPDGPLWSFQSLPHQCGTLGAHVLTDCTPVDPTDPVDGGGPPPAAA